MAVLTVHGIPTAVRAADREHQVKTGFIYSVAKYCDWDLARHAGNHFVVGIYRTRAFDFDIEILNGKLLAKRTIVVESIRNESDIPNCQVVIVGDLPVDEISHLVTLCRNSGTLLVGESNNFARYGGTVGFIVKDGSVRFQVNLKSAQITKVGLQSKLLILAEQVYR